MIGILLAMGAVMIPLSPWVFSWAEKPGKKARATKEKWVKKR